MAKEKIIILGAGGMGREILTYYHDLGMADSIAGFAEQNSHRPGELIRGTKVLDEVDLPDAQSSVKLVAGIGNPLRRKWITKLEAAGYQFDTLIHPTAYLGQNVIVGEGSVVCPGSILTSDLEIGRHCIVNVKASLSHDCRLGDYVTVSPGATVGGHVEIGDGSWVGIGATIIQNIKIGRGVFIGAGAVVVDDIPDNVLVVGVPAVIIRELQSEDWSRLL